MKCFSLDERGDVMLQKHDVLVTEGAALLSQKIRQVLSTNRGEWQLNEREGVPVRRIMVKNPNYGMIKDYIRSAVRQVDPTLVLHSCRIEAQGRRLLIRLEITSLGGRDEITLEV